ncbi:hypothetical protein SAMN05216405_0184 [Lachnospiraceae bacterium NLAE-zl-G231]|nr:hypothetical protein SAMN05216405_0184 [Lachnospiraceae bacterium NLAE-zl-G231]
MTLLYLQPFLQHKSPSPSNGPVYPAVTCPGSCPPLSPASPGYTEDPRRDAQTRRNTQRDQGNKRTNPRTAERKRPPQEPLYSRGWQGKEEDSCPDRLQQDTQAHWMERGSYATHFYVFLPAVLDKKGRMGYDLNNRENVFRK